MVLSGIWSKVSVEFRLFSPFASCPAVRMRPVVALALRPGARVLCARRQLCPRLRQGLQLRRVLWPEEEQVGKESRQPALPGLSAQDFLVLKYGVKTPRSCICVGTSQALAVPELRAGRLVSDSYKDDVCF